MGYQDAYENNHKAFKITQIVWEDDYKAEIGVQTAEEKFEAGVSEAAPSDVTNAVELVEYYDNRVEQSSFDPEEAGISKETKADQEYQKDLKEGLYQETTEDEDGNQVSVGPKDGGQLESLDSYRSIIEEQKNKRTSAEEADKKVKFRYQDPAISVDMSGRFVTHEIIGGSTVRQKIGEEPLEVTADGVCTEETASRLDDLRNAKYATISSNRLPDSTLRVQFASISTNPLEDSGAVALTDDNGEFLYSYSISMVEVSI